MKTKVFLVLTYSTSIFKIKLIATWKRSVRFGATWAFRTTCPFTFELSHSPFSSVFKSVWTWVRPMRSLTSEDP